MMLLVQVRFVLHPLVVTSISSTGSDVEDGSAVFPLVRSFWNLNYVYDLSSILRTTIAFFHIRVEVLVGFILNTSPILSFRRSFALRL